MFLQNDMGTVVTDNETYNKTDNELKKTDKEWTTNEQRTDKELADNKQTTNGQGRQWTNNGWTLNGQQTDHKLTTNRHWTDNRASN